MMTGKNKKIFEKWYKALKKESLEFLYESPIEFQIGVYQQYYQETKGWILYVKPYTDKYEIVIDKFWEEKIFRSKLISNNYLSSFKKLFEKADELNNSYLKIKK